LYVATTTQTDGGGDATRELAPLGQFHRRLAPGPEIDTHLSGASHPTDVEGIEKGSLMSVPVVPGFDTSDTARQVSTSLAPRGVNLLSDLAVSA
jgi:hypothetical protein